MLIEVLKSKIHCARVTEANLNYMGSITIDEDLLDAAGMIAGETVAIVDKNNGERFEPYSPKCPRSGFTMSDNLRATWQTPLKWPGLYLPYITMSSGASLNWCVSGSG